MDTIKQPYRFRERKLIIEYSALFCETPAQLLGSELFGDVLSRFLGKISRRKSLLHIFLKESFPDKSDGDIASVMVNLFRLLAGHTADEISGMNAEFAAVLSKPERVNEFKEELYNFWRRLERIIYFEIPVRKEQAKSDVFHAQFLKASENLKSLVLSTHRRVGKNLLGKYPRVYRQLPAGSNMGMLTKKIEWKCPEFLHAFSSVPFVRLTVIESPLILYTHANKRKGGFDEIQTLPAEIGKIDPAPWFCLPVKVGECTAFVYFHQDFSSMALSLANLFEIAQFEEIVDKKPDLVIFFGITGDALKGNTAFYEDRETGILTGFVKHSRQVDYFGYMKKIILTLHNVRMINMGRMPVHGAMVNFCLKNGGSANVVIMGDSGAGKSETLEALRELAGEHISDMKVIFDDMGSLAVSDDGRVLGYGTEIGAFVRLDDLAPGYAYEEIDRSIFMNPHRRNARLVIPITAYHNIVRGYPVDFFLYANNYDYADSNGSLIDLEDDIRAAMDIFRNGARFAKGTTDEKGLVHTYFANPFGAPQRKEQHEQVALRLFEAMYRQGVRVGQIRTRLGIEGFEQEGPKAASIELFKIVRANAERAR